jgi:hypothetical protein
MLLQIYEINALPSLYVFLWSNVPADKTRADSGQVMYVKYVLGNG